MKLSYLCAMGGLLSCSIALAGHKQVQDFLNQVAYPVTVETWVESNTAQVTLNINATAQGKDLTLIRDKISAGLKQLSPSTKWHLTAFTRTETDSGLEQIQAQAQTRLSDQDLVLLSEKIKQMNQPGLNFSIDNTLFVPSFAQIQEAKTKLRQQIYQEVKSELQRLNATYPNQKFVVHNIRFDALADNSTGPQPLMLAKMANGAGAMPVNSKLIMNANVVLATIPIALEGAKF